MVLQAVAGPNTGSYRYSLGPWPGLGVRGLEYWTQYVPLSWRRAVAVSGAASRIYNCQSIIKEEGVWIHYRVALLHFQSQQEISGSSIDKGRDLRSTVCVVYSMTTRLLPPVSRCVRKKHMPNARAKGYTSKDYLKDW